MSSRPMLPAAERLLALLPQLFRLRDHEQAVRIAAAQGFDPPDPLVDVPEGPLVTLLAALGQQFDLLEAEVEWLYEDQFIETCADWVVPYIGALVGARIVDVGDTRSARLQVADTIRDRRAKGTARALAGRAAAVMAAPAEAIEYAAHVASTFNPNFPGDSADMTLAINGSKGRVLGLSSTIGRRVTELRDIREGGRFAPQNIGARVWIARSIPHAEVVPFAVQGGQPGRFRFDPLGRDLRLWARATERAEDRPRLEAHEIPGPIPLTAAVDNAGAYYGVENSVSIALDGVDQLIDAICFCDLGDDGGPGQWNAHGSVAEKAKIRIDPHRGRFLLPGGGAGVGPDTIRVRYHFGAVLEAGGARRTADVAGSEAALRELLGERDRRPPVPLSFERAIAPPPPAIIPSDTTPSQASGLLSQALDTVDAEPAVLLEFGGSTTLPPLTVLPQEGNFELRGGGGVWPTLLTPVPWRIEAGAGAMLTLRGLRIAGDDIVVAARGLRQLTLIDCTVVPGSGGLRIEEPACTLLIVRSIVGRLRVAPSANVLLVDSLVDSADADLSAVAALDDAAGGILWAERSTIVGDVHLLAFDEVSNCLFASRPTRSLAAAPVTADRLQKGCVRYSALPSGSLAPRRYRCFREEGDTTSPDPVFASLTYGDPHYGTLVAANSEPLLTGAENGGEMGIGNRTSYHRRKRLLDRDLVDWVPFGMAVATELMKD